MDIQIPNLVVIRGLSADELLDYVREQIRRQPHYHGFPIVPSRLEIKIVPLRVEPDIEDEP